MTTTVPLAFTDAACAVSDGVSRRFYVHEGSFTYLATCHPKLRGELSTALAYSAASRVAAHALEEALFLDGHPSSSDMRRGAQLLNVTAAGKLEELFRCFVHLVPTEFGATRFLLDPEEQVYAWCYESGYFTYATGPAAAVVMYSETGSLRELRSQIRQSPESDSTLQMITGPSLFLADQAFGTGSGTANHYKQHASRLSRYEHGESRLGQPSFDIDEFGDELRSVVRPRKNDPGWEDLLQKCLDRAAATVRVVLTR
jgi:hypothetical protein